MRQFVLGSVTGGVLVGLACLAWVPSAPASAPEKLATSATAAAACPALPPVAAVAPAPVCPVQARPAAASAAADPGSLPAPSKTSTAGVLPPPPPMSDEHARILATPAQRLSLPELHARLLEQPKDAVWSADTEDMIRRDLAAANDKGEFDIPTVECRATMCEVLAFGSAPNSAQKWSRLVADLQKSWYGAGLLTHFTLTSEANGRAVIVSILERPDKP